MKKKNNKFSIVIPTYNEKQNIALLVNKIDKYLRNFFYEIIVIDDNSQDGTKLVLKEIKSSKKNFLFYIRKKENRDLSQSLILGIKKTKFNNIIIMDGDLQHNPKYLPKIIRVFFEKKIDLLVCVRNFKKRSGLSIIRYFASLSLIFFINIFLGRRVSDPMSGFFIFKKKIYISNKKNIYGKGFKLLFDLIYFSKRSLKIKEYMIIFSKRKNNKSKMNLKVICHIFVAIFYNMLMKLLR
ncbi:MAG TPA: glycosyltransferase [Candidatus Pelagibacter bacterium]|jgi:dolichol-phosphate mannosyltransferase|nr:glycosyltransferase [Candidatus Pelagibacter bacterium]|tara:strand:- start:116 stop:832 length:717 start_codon:yes stop_codon:yes gene_type:complete